METATTYNDLAAIERLRAHYKTACLHGVVVVVDGQQLTYKKWCKSLVVELAAITGKATIYKNMNSGLCINYDNE